MEVKLAEKKKEGQGGRGNIHAYIQCNVVSLIRGVVLAIGSNVKPVQTGRLD